MNGRAAPNEWRVYVDGRACQVVEPARGDGIVPSFRPDRRDILGPFACVEVRFVDREYVRPSELPVKEFGWRDTAEHKLSGGAFVFSKYDYSKATHMSVPGHGGSDELYEPGVCWGYEVPPRLAGFDVFLPRDAEITFVRSSSSSTPALKISWHGDQIATEYVPLP